MFLTVLIAVTLCTILDILRSGCVCVCVFVCVCVREFECVRDLCYWQIESHTEHTTQIWKQFIKQTRVPFITGFLSLAQSSMHNLFVHNFFSSKTL